MKITKGLLLGSAAGLLAMGGAQAADLPVKAKAVEYVKICSIYGAGFFYIPGQDTCLKIGGYVRAEMAFGQTRGTGATEYYGNVAQRNRDNDQQFMRGRVNLNFDVRQNTEYGLLRAYLNLDLLHNSTNGAGPGGASVFNAGITANSIGILTYAYIQFAGFTMGKAQSLFSVPFWGTGFINAALPGFTDTTSGQTGVIQFAYTASLGNGLSVSAGIQDATLSHMQLYDASYQLTNPFGATSVIAQGAASGQYMPDFVANAYLDQAWGAAFGAVIVHDLSATYFNNGAIGAQTAQGAASTTLFTNGHPGNTIAWGVTGGLQIKNIPTGPGDYVYMIGTFGDGMPNVSFNPLTANGAIGVRGYDNPQTVAGAGLGGFGYGLVLDGVFGGPGRQNIQKTRSWGIMGAFDHYWIAGVLRSSIFGGYANVDYNATANALLCGAAQSSAGVIRLSTTSNCNFDVRVATVGTRTSWFPVKTLQIDAEVSYTHLDLPLTGTINPNSANYFPGVVGANGATNTYALKSQNVLTFEARAQRSF